MKNIQEILDKLQIPYFNSMWSKRDEIIRTDFDETVVSCYSLKENKNLFKIPEKALMQTWKQAQISLLEDLKLGLERDTKLILDKKDSVNPIVDHLMGDGHKLQRVKYLKHIENMLEALNK